MSASEMIDSGVPPPRLKSIRYINRYYFEATWVDGVTETLDLAPLIETFKVYSKLRDNPTLLKSVHLIDDGVAVAWGENDELDAGADTLERYAVGVEQPSTSPQPPALVIARSASTQTRTSRGMAFHGSSYDTIPPYRIRSIRFFHGSERTHKSRNNLTVVRTR
jgi:hypothetical protein